MRLSWWPASVRSHAVLPVDRPLLRPHNKLSLMNCFRCPPLRRLALFLAVVAAASDVTTRADDKPLNVLFIAVDDLRPELGCYGNPHIHTPNIDRLAAGGTVFRRAYCQVAVCGASRASLLTGLRPTPRRFLNYLTWAEKDAPSARTLPEEFRRHGYQCLSNGKVFHHRDDTADRSWSERPWKPDISGTVTRNPESKALRGGRKNRGPVFEAADVADNAYPDGQTADRTIADLHRLQQQNQRFFLACGFLKPHLPLYAPQKYWDLYAADKIELADNRFPPRHAPGALKGSGEIHSYHNRDIPFNSEQWHRSCRHGYYACVSYIDAQIGRILQTLDELKLRDHTIVCLWGDHGWHLGEHNFWGKHNVMHLSTNAPLIVSAPGFSRGQTCDRLVEFVDIYPTLCELAGITTDNSQLAGTSFRPLLTDARKPWKSAVYSKFGPAVSVITEQYNYAEFENGERMLFDLHKDAAENVNIAAEPDRAPVVERLSRLLHEPK